MSLDTSPRMDLDVLKVPIVPRLSPPVLGPTFFKANAQLPNVLKLMGYAKLRSGQDKVVMNLLMRRDTISLQPTGSGKSASYIIPTICHNWKCVIFSPLISLMQDQLDSLLRYHLSAAQISSGQTDAENSMALRLWEAGDLQFLLVAPERLRNEDFISVMRKVRPNLVCIDEAHCVSSWAHTFRPAYGEIGHFIAAIKPDTVLGLTATATKRVENDIKQIIGVADAQTILYYPKRENLRYSCVTYKDPFTIRRLLEKNPGPSIVYSNTRKNCEALYNMIGADIDGGSLVYHGGMTSDERTTNQESFMKDRIRVMFATNAFGLGVNKANIRNVIHRDLPDCIESYTQESGRGGRDGFISQCILCYDPQSASTIRWMIDQEFPDAAIVSQVFHYLNRVKNDQGCLVLTGKQIAEATGLDERAVGSSMVTLEVSKVIERTKDEEPPLRIKIVHAEHPDDTFQKYIAAVSKYGFKGTDGVYEVKESVLIEQGKLKKTKLRDTYKLLDENGYVQFTAPFRGKGTKIVGDISMVNFGLRLALRNEKLRRLQQMEAYVDVPDDVKHDFLQNYFVPEK